MKEVTETCLQCMECCKWLGFVITAKDEESLDEMVQMYQWRGAEVKAIKGNQVFIIVPSACKHLTQFGCGIYHTRPGWCRRYDGRLDPAMNDKCLLIQENIQKGQSNV